MWEDKLVSVGTTMELSFKHVHEWRKAKGKVISGTGAFAFCMCAEKS